MKCTEVDKFPINVEGDLTKNKHVFSKLQRSIDDCGSHGCTGHSDYRLICSCGYVGYEKSADQHKKAVILSKLGLTFDEA